MPGDADLAARLAGEWDITTLSRPLLEAYAALNPAPALAELIAGDGWRAYVPGRQLLDLLEDFPPALTPEQLTGLLRKLPPRLYSVASSLKAAPDEAHLLVGRRALPEPRARAPRRRLDLRRRAAARRATR